MRLLLIEDDPTVTKGIELMLTSEDIEVQTTELGQDGLDLGRVFLYDLILLDLNLPDMSGYEVLRSLRLGNIKTPVLILSGLDGTEHKVKGLGLGADDYLTKPFQSDELIARIRAILRRSGDRVESVIRCGDLTLKLDQKRAEMGRRDVGLTTKEYRMLELLAIGRGPRSRRTCSSATSTAEWTSQARRSSTCLSVSFAKSSCRRPVEGTTSRRSVGEATSCGTLSQ